jgi:hypothetical protein
MCCAVTLREAEVVRAVQAFDYDADCILGQAELVHLLTAAVQLAAPP